MLKNASILNSTDILEINGTHLPDHTDDDVTSVFYLENKILYFNGEILGKFSNLKHIILINQGLMEIGESAFDVCSNLEELMMAIDGVTKFPSKMLKSCMNLKKVFVIEHKLTEIPEDLFGDTENLEEFWITNNKLTSLPEKLLKNMQNLRTFAAQQNHLKELSPNFFINAPNLQEVNISKNEFKDPQNIMNALNGHTNLVKLDISSNDFPNFDFTFFSQFIKLEKLVAGSKAGPELTEISWQLLPASLVDLTIYDVGEDLPENMCSQLVNLNSLSVTGYGIKNLHKNTFKLLGHLEMLSVQDTRVKALDPELFAGLTSLSDLNLNYNFLNQLPAGIFASLVNIGSKSEFHGIHMFANNLQRLNANFFGQHPHLRTIDFSSNLIEEVERGIFNKFHSNLTFVNFQKNFCVDQLFINVVNLDEDDRLTLCFNNWASKTPGGCGNNFKKFEVFVIIFVGFSGILINF